MKKLKPITFLLCLLVLCWLGMQAIHELGHCLAAVISGGTITKIVLDPLSISRVDVSPNPHPMFVVWAGPILGCIIPILVWRLAPEKITLLKDCLGFFAGFCCVANGAYLAFGTFGRIGDCGTMLNLGCNKTIMVSYGIVTLLIGFAFWHQLGSPKQLFENSDWCSAKHVWIVLLLLASVAGIGRFCFPV